MVRFTNFLYIQRLMMFEALKIIHLISLISWFAMLFYLPRLFVYHAENSENEGFIKVVRIMEYKLYTYIGITAMLATFISGVGLITVYMNADINLFKTGGWLHVKLLFVFFLFIYTLYLGNTVKKLATKKPTKSGKFYRVINEVPTLFLIFIIIITITKPF